MISRDQRIRLWASQFEATELPAVCVFSGAPAETWRKFRVHTAPFWALVFLALIACGIGFVVSGPLIYLVSRRVTGRLPMRKVYDRRLSRATWISVAVAVAGLLIGGAALLAMDSGNPTIGILGVLVTPASLIALVMGVLGIQIGFQLAWNPFAPWGKVLKRRTGDPDRIVELWNLHPDFVAATNRMYAERAGPQIAGMEVN